MRFVVVGPLSLLIAVSFTRAQLAPAPAPNAARETDQRRPAAVIAVTPGGSASTNSEIVTLRVSRY